MSVAEIKAEMEKLPREEVMYLAAFAKHLARRNEPGYGASLDAGWEGMEKGDKVSGAEFRRLVGELEKTGLGAVMTMP